MSKKYIFAKLFPSFDDPVENVELSELEIGSFLDPYTNINNIFQLIQYDDLNRLIAKSEVLQQRLISRLPENGRHGYLWFGDPIPDLNRLIWRPEMIYEIYLFQHQREPAPEIVKGPFARLTEQLKIYNWHVYRIYSFQFLLQRSAMIRNKAENEIEIDRYFDYFFDNLYTPDYKSDAYLKIRAIIESTVNDNFYLNSDKRSKKTKTFYPWVRALINYLLPEEKGTVYLPFCDTGNLVFETLFSGNIALGAEINPVDIIYARSAFASIDFAPETYTRVISELFAQIKSLTSDSAAPQIDLFLTQTQNDFSGFWQKEKERLQSFDNDMLNTEDLKYIAVVRFLIEQNHISRDESINNFLLAALLNAITGYTKNKQSDDFPGYYRKALRQLYLDLFTFNKIKPFIQIHNHQNRIHRANAINIEEINDHSIDAVLCFLQGSINKDGFKNDRLLLNLLNPEGGMEAIQDAVFGFKSPPDNKMEAFWDEIGSQTGRFENLNKYGQNILTRLWQDVRRNDAARFLKLWDDYYRFLIEVARITRDKAKIGLICENTEIKIGGKYEEVHGAEVVIGFIENRRLNLPFNLAHQLTKMSEHFKFGRFHQLRIIILEKTAQD